MNIENIISERLMKIVIKQVVKENYDIYLSSKKNFNAELVSRALKLSPKDLSGKLFSKLLSLVFSSLSNINYTLPDYYQEITENEDVVKEYKSFIQHRKKIENKSKQPMFFKYIAYNFQGLYFCNYQQFLRTFRKKVFMHYGEETIHQASYIKKSRINYMEFNPQLSTLPITKLEVHNFDNEKAKEFFKTHHNLYWIVAGLYPSLFLNEEPVLPSLKEKLKEIGLIDKGWDFLIKQNVNYNIRFAQNFDLGIFCANFGLKDAWLRLPLLKSLFSKNSIFLARNAKIEINESKEIDIDYISRMYVILGRACQEWTRPVSKFSLLNLKLFSKMFKQERKRFFEKMDLEIEQGKFSIENPMFRTMILYYKKNFHDFELENEFFFYKSLSEIFNKANPIPDEEENKIVYINKYQQFIDFLQATNDSHKKTSKKDSLQISLNVQSLFKDIIQSFYEEAIRKIKDKYGDVFKYHCDNQLSREVYMYEMENFSTLDNVKKDNPLLFEDLIKSFPYTGLNFFKDVKEQLNLGKKTWKYIYNCYLKLDYTPLSCLKNIKKETVGLNSKKYDKYNRTDSYNLLLNNAYYQMLCEKIDKINFCYLNIILKEVDGNFDLLEDCLRIFDLFSLNLNEYDRKVENYLKFMLPYIVNFNKNKEESEESEFSLFLIYIFPESKKRFYLKRYEERNLSYYLRRDMDNIFDYIRSDVDYGEFKSISRLIEMTEEYHDNLRYKHITEEDMHTFKKEEIQEVYIDKRYIFEHIVDTKRMIEESKKMKHCILSYNPVCHSDRYVVYHAFDTQDNVHATLGITKVDDQYTFSQMYGIYNDVLEEQYVNAGKYLISCLNNLFSGEKIKEQGEMLEI